MADREVTLPDIIGLVMGWEHADNDPLTIISIENRRWQQESRSAVAHFFYRYRLQTCEGAWKGKEKTNHGNLMIVSLNGQSTKCDRRPEGPEVRPCLDHSVDIVTGSGRIRSRACRLLRETHCGDFIENANKILVKFLSFRSLRFIDMVSGVAIGPLHGALLHLIATCAQFPRVSKALCVSMEGRDHMEEVELAFFIPRRSTTVIVGGIVKKCVKSVVSSCKTVQRMPTDRGEDRSFRADKRDDGSARSAKRVYSLFGYTTITWTLKRAMFSRYYRLESGSDVCLPGLPCIDVD